MPKTMEEMLTLPGVARKTANIVLANAYDVVVGIGVDTHVARLAQKLDLTDYNDPIRIEKDLMDIMPKKEWKNVNHRIVVYGREIFVGRRQ